MTDGSSSKARAFFVVLAAVLVGAGVISVIKSCSETSTHWETKKTELVRMLRENDEDIDTMIAKPPHSMSLEELEKFGPRLKALQDIRTDGYSTLARLLEQKPLFSLNAEETQLLRKAKRESGEPIPEEVPLFAILKEEASVYTQDSVHVVIPNQTRVRVIEKRGSYYAIEYEGNRFFILVSSAQRSN